MLLNPTQFLLDFCGISLAASFYLYYFYYILGDGKLLIARIREWFSRHYSSKKQLRNQLPHHFLNAMREHDTDEQTVLLSNKIIRVISEIIKKYMWLPKVSRLRTRRPGFLFFHFLVLQFWRSYYTALRFRVFSLWKRVQVPPHSSNLLRKPNEIMHGNMFWKLKSAAQNVR